MENNILTFNEETHEYFLGGAKLPGVTTILKDQGIIDLSGIPFTRLEAAREFGKAVHLTCQLFDQDNLNEKKLDHNLRPYLDGWAKFIDDKKVIFKEIEKPVCSTRYRFAGTPDRVGTFDGFLTIIEIKSTAELAPATALQTAAYQIAYNKNPEFDAQRRVTILLQPDGKYKIEPYKDKSDASVFLSALSVYNWKRRNLK